MRIVDLTRPIYDHMPVYPGDPDLAVSQVYTLEKDGWNMKRIAMNLHDGTHVNAPAHADPDGKTLDRLPAELFTGPCVRYAPGMAFDKTVGVLFDNVNPDMEIARALVAAPPKFVVVSDAFEMDLEVEKFLLVHGIISYENVANTKEVPDAFTFYGFPLPIRDGDGSPVRAVAIFE